MTFFSFFSTWQQAPTLSLGVLALLGSLLALNGSWFIILITILLFCPFYLNKFLVLGTITVGFFFFYTLLFHAPQTFSESSGKGILEVHNIKDQKGKFGQSLQVKGKLSGWNDEKPLDVSMTVKKSQKRTLLRSKKFHVEGSLKKSQGGTYYLKGSLKPVDSSASFPAIKYKIKSLIKNSLEKWYPERNAAELLEGLLLGDYPSAGLHHFFNRYGLQHLLAISGFHFCMLAWIAGLFLKKILPRSITPGALLLCMTLYTAIIDPSPSVLRAFVTFVLFQSQELFSRESSGLNRLGAALLVVLLYDPTFSLKIGFQFSFLVTASLLLLHPIIDSFLKFAIPDNQAYYPSSPEKWSFGLKNIIRKIISLCLSVHIVAIPLSLFWFGNYPLLGILYNLFFPFLVTIILLVFFAGLLLTPITPIIHTLNGKFICWAISTFSLPSSCDLVLKIECISPLVITLYITLLFGAGLILHKSEGGRSGRILEYY